MILRKAGTVAIVITYLLVLLTQIPHIFAVYEGLEQQKYSIDIAGISLSTALGASLAFELSIAILTWRLITYNTSHRSKWTRWGVVGFLAMSAVANLSYYFSWNLGPVSLDNDIMPFLLALALPLSLFLFAEEFSAEGRQAVKSGERQKRKEQQEIERKAAIFDYDPKAYTCWCGEWAPEPEKHKTEAQARGGLGAHSRVHRYQARDLMSENGGSPGRVREWFDERYKEARNGKELPGLPEAWEIGKWMT